MASTRTPTTSMVSSSVAVEGTHTTPTKPASAVFLSVFVVQAEQFTIIQLKLVLGLTTTTQCYTDTKSSYSESSRLFSSCKLQVIDYICSVRVEIRFFTPVLIVNVFYTMENCAFDDEDSNLFRSILNYYLSTCGSLSFNSKHRKFMFYCATLHHQVFISKG